MPAMVTGQVWIGVSACIRSVRAASPTPTSSANIMNKQAGWLLIRLVFVSNYDIPPGILADSDNASCESVL